MDADTAYQAIQVLRDATDAGTLGSKKSFTSELRQTGHPVCARGHLMDAFGKDWWTQNIPYWNRMRFTSENDDTRKGEDRFTAVSTILMEAISDG